MPGEVRLGRSQDAAESFQRFSSPPGFLAIRWGAIRSVVFPTRILVQFLLNHHLVITIGETMNEFTRLLDDSGLKLNRRHFFSRGSLGLGGAALASLLSEPG